VTGWVWTSLVGSVVHLDWRVLTIGRVTVTLMGCALLVGLCRRAPAANRHTLWAAALGGALILTLSGLAAAPDSLLMGSGAGAGWIVAWGAGAAAMSGRTILGLVLTARLRRRASPLADADCHAVLARVAEQVRLGASPALLESAEVSTPLTFGWRRPVVLLPAGARTWPVERLRAVLLHELSHVARRDWLHGLADCAACAVYWFHPVVHWAAHRRRVEAERACDEAVIAAGVRPTVYATLLVDLASTTRGPARGLAIPFTVPQRSELEERVRGVLRGDSRPARSAFVIAGSALVLLAAGSLAISSAPTACPLAAARAAQSGAPTAPGVSPTAATAFVR
jgi:hypothetical protein